MAAPKEIRIIYSDGTKGQKLDGVGISGSNTWATWVRTRQTGPKDISGTAQSKNRYRDTEISVIRKGFNLHCQTCLEKGCYGSLLKAQPTNTTSWKIGMRGWFAHYDVDPDSHEPDCPCYRHSEYRYKVNAVHRTVILKPDLYISNKNQQYLLRFSVDLTKMYEHEKENEISEKDRIANYNMIYSAFASKVQSSILLEKPDPKGIIISGVVQKMPDSEFNLIESKGKLWGNPNIGKIILKFFDYEKLDLLVWKRATTWGEARLEPVIVSHQQGKSVQMTIHANENYVWNNHPDSSIIKSKIKGMPTVPRTGSFNNPIGQFTKVDSESVQQVVSQIFEKHDLDVSFENSNIYADIIGVDYNKKLSHILAVTNNSDSDYLVTGELQEFGTKYRGIDDYENKSKYDLSVGEDNVERFSVESGKTKMFPLLITGSGRMVISAIPEDEDGEISQRILLSKSIYDEKDRKLRISQLSKEIDDWEILIPALLKASMINGFDDYEELPPNHEEIDDILLADIMRHKYTSMESKNELVHSGTITGTMNKLQGLAENLELDETSSKPQKSHQLLSYLFESQYNKIENQEMKQAQRVWDIDASRDFKLIGYEEGYFSPNNDTEWALLISRKSLSQLKKSFPSLSTNDIKFLTTGHRLINRQKASTAGLQQLDRLPSLDIYPENPVDFLLAHFDKSSEYIEGSEEEYPRCHWLNLGGENSNQYLSLYADSLIKEPRASELWSQTKQTELKLDIANGETWYLSIQRLANEPQSAEDEDRWAQIFFLHLHKCNNEKEYESHRVMIYNSAGASPPSVIKDYYDSRGPDEKRMLLGQHLRDVFRAFIAASGQIKNLRNPVDSLAPYNYRKTIIQPFHERNSNLFNEITSIDSHPAISLSNYAKVRLWLQE